MVSEQRLRHDANQAKGRGVRVRAARDVEFLHNGYRTYRSLEGEGEGTYFAGSPNSCAKNVSMMAVFPTR